MGFEQLATIKAQQNQGTRSMKGVSDATSPYVDAGGEIKQRSKPPRTSADDAARVVATLQKNFPRAFPRGPAHKVPLQVRILKDVLAHAALIQLSERDIRNGIELCYQDYRYWTSLTEGNVRIDLHGAVVGAVSADEAVYGKNAGRTHSRANCKKWRSAAAERHTFGYRALVFI
jgi:ProP effector